MITNNQEVYLPSMELWKKVQYYPISDKSRIDLYKAIYHEADSLPYWNLTQENKDYVDKAKSLTTRAVNILEQRNDNFFSDYRMKQLKEREYRNAQYDAILSRERAELYRSQRDNAIRERDFLLNKDSEKCSYCSIQ